MDIHNDVVLSPWREDWGKIFSDEKDKIIFTLEENGHHADVYHVGGTSINGMMSKPIIDILVCPGRQLPLDSCITDLVGIGYQSLGECGRPGRYFFSKGDQPNQTFYLHLCYDNNKVARDQLLFQRIEQENPDVCRQYMTMKLMLKSLFPDNRYLYRQLKGIFIEGVLAAWGMYCEIEFQRGRGI